MLIPIAITGKIFGLPSIAKTSLYTAQLPSFQVVQMQENLYLWSFLVNAPASIPALRFSPPGWKSWEGFCALMVSFLGNFHTSAMFLCGWQWWWNFHTSAMFLCGWQWWWRMMSPPLYKSKSNLNALWRFWLIFRSSTTISLSYREDLCWLQIVFSC